MTNSSHDPPCIDTPSYIRAALITECGCEWAYEKVCGCEWVYEVCGCEWVYKMCGCEWVYEKVCGCVISMIL